MELLKDYDVDILYHLGKANVVANALNRRSMGSLSYLQPEKRGMAHEVHKLASLGVRLLNLGDIKITTKCNECNYNKHSVVHTASLSSATFFGMFENNEKFFNS